MDIIRKYADAGDIVNLRYVFSGAFDADPTFEQYEDDYQYCKRKGVLEGHRELTPLTDDASRWTEDYWYKVQGDLQKNLSDKRLTHMKKMAKVVFKDKVERLRKERAYAQQVEEEMLRANRDFEEKQRRAEEERRQRMDKQPRVDVVTVQRIAKSPQLQSKDTVTMSDTESAYAQQVERENQRKEEEMLRANRDYEEKQRRKQRMDEQRRADARDTESDGGVPKKAVGIAAIVLILILLAILLVMFLGNNSSRNPQTNLSDQTNVATSAPETETADVATSAPEESPN